MNGPTRSYRLALLQTTMRATDTPPAIHNKPKAKGSTRWLLRADNASERHAERRGTRDHPRAESRMYCGPPVQQRSGFLLSFSAEAVRTALQKNS